MLENYLKIGTILDSEKRASSPIQGELIMENILVIQQVSEIWPTICPDRR